MFDIWVVPSWLMTDCHLIKHTAINQAGNPKVPQDSPPNVFKVNSAKGGLPPFQFGEKFQFLNLPILNFDLQRS